MTAKEYLNQAFRIDQRINSKLEQIESLRTLLTKTSSTLSDMPKNPNKSHTRTEDLIIKIMMIEDEIKPDIDKLVSWTRQDLLSVKATQKHSILRNFILIPRSIRSGIGLVALWLTPVLPTGSSGPIWLTL